MRIQAAGRFKGAVAEARASGAACAGCGDLLLAQLELLEVVGTAV